MNLPRRLPGLDVYRAVAIILMMFAHAARLEVGLMPIDADFMATPPDQWLPLASLKYEPVISAMFLFLVGVGTVLSLAGGAHDIRAWRRQQVRRALQLLGISIVFGIADGGVQWPDSLVSSGVLSIIAVAGLTTVLALSGPRPVMSLVTLVIGGTLVTWQLDTTNTSIPGLNAGAGGLLPLVTIAWTGAICGQIWQHFKITGLQIALATSLLLALVALSVPGGWVTYPVSWHVLYPGDEVEAVINSLKDVVGLYHGPRFPQSSQYWNHSSLFLPRALPLLLAALLWALTTRQAFDGRAARALGWLGRHSLALYLIHLVLLAGVELSGIRPNAGWHTWLLVGIMLAISPPILRGMSITRRLLTKML